MNSSTYLTFLIGVFNQTQPIYTWLLLDSKIFFILQNQLSLYLVEDCTCDTISTPLLGKEISRFNQSEKRVDDSS